MRGLTRYAELFGKKGGSSSSKKLKKKHLKRVDPKDLRKLTVAITNLQTACGKHFHEMQQAAEPKIAHFMGLLGEVGAFKSSVPQEVQQLLDGHSEFPLPPSFPYGAPLLTNQNLS
jgi:hypothetical protein